MPADQPPFRDLTVGPVAPGDTPAEDLPGPRFVEVLRGLRVTDDLYDPARDREETRGKIAIWLVISLLLLVYSALVIAVATAVACSAKDSCSVETSSLSSTKVVIEMLISPLVGLVGAVAGFYFGEKSAKGAG